MLTYARADPAADVRPHAVEIGEGGVISLIATTPRGPLPLDVRLRGGFNVENVLCAVAVAEVLELPHDGRARGDRGGTGRARPVRAGRRGPAVHGARRLRAHARRARERAALGARDHRRAADLRVRVRRRPRPRQAPAHGRGRRAAWPTRRSSRPTTRAARIRRRSSPRSRPASTWTSSSTGEPRSSGPSRRPAPATSS